MCPVQTDVLVLFPPHQTASHCPSAGQGMFGRAVGPPQALSTAGFETVAL